MLGQCEAKEKSRYESARDRLAQVVADEVVAAASRRASDESGKAGPVGHPDHPPEGPGFKYGIAQVVTLRSWLSLPEGALLPRPLFVAGRAMVETEHGARPTYLLSDHLSPGADRDVEEFEVVPYPSLGLGGLMQALSLQLIAQGKADLVNHGGEARLVLKGAA